MSQRILLAEDDPAQLRQISAILGSAGFEVEGVTGGQPALEALTGPDGAEFAAALLDVHMPDLDGIAVIRRLREAQITLPVVVLTSDGSVSRAVEAMRAGASDFLVKPVGPERLEVSIRNALALGTLSSEVRRLTRQADNRLSFDELIARSPATRQAIALARRVARSDMPVLIEGESGTGKEVFARAIHGSSARAGRPFVAVNCGALPSTLVESILFGHEKGAFTGATERRPGRFQEADGGTLFLDEIGDLPMEAQVKLLRALQTGEIEPVGASRPVRVDVRLISATNRNLERMVAEGRFREDLYYRISVFPLTLPPLRERREDIPALARMFLVRHAAAEGVPVEDFSTEAMEMIARAPWPGNVRQLENVIRRAVILAEGSQIRPADLRGMAPAIREAPAGEMAAGAGAGGTGGGVAAAGAAAGPVTAVHGPATERGGEAGPSRDPFLTPEGHVRRLRDIEAEAIARALALYRGRMAEAARRLGIGRSTLYRKVDEYRLETPEGAPGAGGARGAPVSDQPGSMPRAAR